MLIQADQGAIVSPAALTAWRQQFAVRRNGVDAALPDGVHAGGAGSFMRPDDALRVDGRGPNGTMPNGIMSGGAVPDGTGQTVRGYGEPMPDGPQTGVPGQPEAAAYAPADIRPYGGDFANPTAQSDAMPLPGRPAWEQPTGVSLNELKSTTARLRPSMPEPKAAKLASAGLADAPISYNHDGSWLDGFSLAAEQSIGDKLGLNGRVSAANREVPKAEAAKPETPASDTPGPAAQHPIIPSAAAMADNVPIPPERHSRMEAQRLGQNGHGSPGTGLGNRLMAIAGIETAASVHGGGQATGQMMMGSVTELAPELLAARILTKRGEGAKAAPDQPAGPANQNRVDIASAMARDGIATDERLKPEPLQPRRLAL